jgi:site-specific recombinase XerD
MLAVQKPGSVLTDHDRKQVFRELMRKLGGITEDAISKEMKGLFAQVGLGPGIRPYDLRGAVTTDMKIAGIAHLELRYLTGHSTNDILNEYTGVDPQQEMQKHFTACRTLLDAIEKRFGELGLATT